MTTRRNAYHHGGTLTYWSVCRRQWVRDASTTPDRELAAIPPGPRARAIERLTAKEARS